MTDHQLLRNIQASQPNAMNDLMAKYSRYAYNVIAYILGHAGQHEDVEELLQDTFLSVWQHADRIQPQKMKSYIGTVARNKAKNWLRDNPKKYFETDWIEIPDQGNSMEDAALRKETARQVQRALRRMNARDREIFLRHYYYLQTAEEIAAWMGLSRNTVLSRLSRGKKILKKELGKEGLS